MTKTFAIYTAEYSTFDASWVLRKLVKHSCLHQMVKVFTPNSNYAISANHATISTQIMFKCSSSNMPFRSTSNWQSILQSQTTQWRHTKLLICNFRRCRQRSTFLNCPKKKKLMQYVQTSDHKVTSANQMHSKNLTTKKPGSLASRILLHHRNHSTRQTNARATTPTKMASPVSTAKSKVTTRTTADHASEITHPASPTVEKPIFQRRSMRSQMNQPSTTSPIRVFTKGFSCSPNWIPGCYATDHFIYL